MSYNWLINASRQERAEFIENSTREQLIAFLSWNDANGFYSDAEGEKEDYPPATLEELQTMAKNQLMDY